VIKAQKSFPEASVLTPFQVSKPLVPGDKVELGTRAISTWATRRKIANLARCRCIVRAADPGLAEFVVLSANGIIRTKNRLASALSLGMSLRTLSIFFPE
jgi:hypothetical protein